MPSASEARELDVTRARCYGGGFRAGRIDARKLLSMLIRYHNGESRVWSVVHVPSSEAEDARHLHRELLTLKSDRTRITNRIAWGWLLFQPDSALTLWYQRRYASRGLRMRKIGIVALARRLLIELWRFSQTGSLPEGAITSP